MARERRVVTPDGHVWYVRRRWARRRPPWSRWSRQPMTRVDADEELAAEDEVVPPVDALFTYHGSDLGDPGFLWWHDERDTLELTLWAIIVVAVLAMLAAAATVASFVTLLVGGQYTLPGGINVVAEYFHNAAGLTPAELRRLFAGRRLLDTVGGLGDVARFEAVRRTERVRSG